MQFLLSHQQTQGETLHLGSFRFLQQLPSLPAIKRFSNVLNTVAAGNSLSSVATTLNLFVSISILVPNIC